MTTITIARHKKKDTYENKTYFLLSFFDLLLLNKGQYQNRILLSIL